jgi:fumarate hydratase subunit beta
MQKIQLPLSAETIRSLHAGDEVRLSGTVYTARDAAHQRLVQMIQEGRPLPFDLNGAVIYYVGPTPARPGEVIGSAGPTSSYRMDGSTPLLLEKGLKGMIGKGRRSQTVIDAIHASGAVYFVAAGGAGALLGSCIKAAEPVAFADLLSEAVLRLTVEDFPCFVGIDSYGKDLYDLG